MVYNGHKVKSVPVKIRYDEGPGWRAQLGYIVIATDRVIERDICLLAPQGVDVHFARIRSVDECTVDTLFAMEKELADAASRLLPECKLDVICFACTAGSAVIGEKRVIAELTRGAPHAKHATTLVGSVMQALNALNVKKIVVAAPYLDEINTIEAKYLQDNGFEILDFQGLNLLLDTDIGRIEPDFIMEYAQRIDCKEAEAIFISCAALRTLDIIDCLEKKISKPVVTSNQAMFWNTLRLAGIEDKIEGYGKLLCLC